MSEAFLVVTAVGTDRPGIVAELTAAVAEHGASVADSRMAILGGEFALMMLISGEAPVLDAARQDIRSVGERLELELIVKGTRSPAAHRAGNVRSYEVQVHALDHPGIVHAVTAALQGLGANIVSLDTSAYEAAVTGAPLFQMTLRADCPAAVTAARLREALDQVTEARNADMDVRPV